MIKNLAAYRSLINNTHNFRDLGGYKTNLGHCLKYGMIYRSDHLGNLCKKDWPNLDHLKIKNIIDLRTSQERQYRPNKLIDPYLINTHRIELSTMTTNLSEFKTRVLKGNLGMVDFHEELLRIYGRFVLQYEEQMSQLFSILLHADNYPLLIHCSSGKDRTGIVSALILAAVGVDQEQVEQDYLLSNEYMRAYTRKTLFYIRLFSLFRAQIHLLRPLLECRPSYLQEVFKSIQNNFGELDNYFKALGLNADKRKRLESILSN